MTDKIFEDFVEQIKIHNNSNGVKMLRDKIREVRKDTYEDCEAQSDLLCEFKTRDYCEQKLKELEG